MESLLSSHLDGNAHRDPQISDYKREISQLEQQVCAQMAAEKKLKEKNLRSVELLKEFLIKQVCSKKHHGSPVFPRFPLLRNSC